jgi:hypothetical protein
MVTMAVRRLFHHIQWYKPWGSKEKAHTLLKQKIFNAAIKCSVDTEKIKWMLTLWACGTLFATRPTKYACHTVSVFTAFDHSSFLKRNFTQTYCTTATMIPETRLMDLFLDLLFVLRERFR